MTDKEIIKALECCASCNNSMACAGCPFDENNICVNDGLAIYKSALDLIKRQQAEIERLEGEVDMYEEERKYHFEMSRQRIVEAIKEVVERFYDECLECPLEDGDLTILVDRRTFDNLVKEMTEGKHDR